MKDFRPATLLLVVRLTTFDIPVLAPLMKSPSRYSTVDSQALIVGRLEKSNWGGYSRLSSVYGWVLVPGWLDIALAIGVIDLPIVSQSQDIP